MFSMIFILPFLFSIVQASQPAFISAIGPSCPYRTGNIYIINQQNIILNQQISVNFQHQLQVYPSGIILSPRTLENVNQTLCIDYYLKPKAISQTSFTLVAKFSEYYAILYNKIIVNYLGIISNLNSIMIVSSFNEYAFAIFSSNDADNKTKTWIFSTQPTANSSTTYCYSEVYASQLSMCGVNSNLSFYQSSASYDNSRKQMTIGFSIIGESVYHLDLSGVVYDRNWRSINYIIYFYRWTLSTERQLYRFNDASYPTLFVGLKSFKTLVLANRFGFDLGFEIEPIDNNNLQYRQLNIYNQINLTQQTAGNFEIKGTITGFTLKQCPPQYPYSLILTSQCFKKCPIGQYANSTNFCSSCFYVKADKIYGECYSNGCSEGLFFKTEAAMPECANCETLFSNCKKCGYDETKSLGCQSCQDNYFLKSSDYKCYLCSELFQKCQECSPDGESCLKYEDEATQIILPIPPAPSPQPSLQPDPQSQPQTQPPTQNESPPQNQDEQPSPQEEGQEPPDQNPQQQDQQQHEEQHSEEQILQCNNVSYFNESTSSCQQCSSVISNCVKCSLSSSYLQCTSCSSNFSDYPQIPNCTNCIYSTFTDVSTNSCKACSSYCTECTNYNTCLSCYKSSTLSTRLYDNYCIECNSNNTDFLSQLPLCCLSAETICMFSKYNPKMRVCEYSEEIKQALGVFATITSLTVIHAFFRQLFMVISLFQDFSYYSFHQRNYSKIIHSFFNEMTLFTLARFKPAFLKGVYSQLNIKFTNLSLKNDIDQAPIQFVHNGGGIYYLNTTQDIWIGTLPMHLGMFIALLVLKWFIGLFKKGFGAQYNVPGFVLILFFESNFQYLSFRTFSQFYQFTPFSQMYYFNLFLTYTVLLLLVSYTVGGSFLYKSVYKPIYSTQYFKIAQSRIWIVYWTTNNILKMSLGFIHACLYYSPLLQSCLLFSVLITKAIMFAKYMKQIKTKFQYILQLFVIILFIILQSFFVVELLMKVRQEYTVYNQIYTGNLEYVIIMMMVISQMLCVLIKLIHVVAGFIIGKVKSALQTQKSTEQTKDEIIYKVTPPETPPKTNNDNSTTDSLQEVDLDDEIAIAIPAKHQRINHQYKSGPDNFSNVNVLKINQIKNQKERSSCQEQSTRHLTNNKYYSQRPKDTDFQSVIQMISNKIKEKKQSSKNAKNKAAASNQNAI